MYLLWLQEKDRLRADRLDEIAIYLFLDCALVREQATRRRASASMRAVTTLVNDMEESQWHEAPSTS